MSETMRSIAEEVAQGYNLTLADLQSPAQERWSAWPRMHAMYEIRRRLPRSYPQIAGFFGRDHTIAMRAMTRWPEVAGQPVPPKPFTPDSPRGPWSDAEVAGLLALEPGTLVAAYAAKIGRSKNAVWNKRNALRRAARLAANTPAKPLPLTEGVGQ